MTTLAFVLLSLGVFTFSHAYYRDKARHTDQLDRIGRSYGVERWNGESNAEYANRIRTRIAIGKGITWRN